MDQHRTDSELLASFAAAGHQQAFTQLVERYLPLVRHIARRYLADSHAADDLAQAVFFCLARKVHRIDGHNLPAWLVRATTLAAKDTMRKHARRQHHERSAATPESPRTSAPSDADPELLHKALLRLSAADRSAVLLRFYCDLSYPQMAQELACSEEAARKRVDRSLHRLHEWLQPHAAAFAPAAIGPLLATWAQQGGGISAAACAAAATTGQLTTVQMAIAHSLLKLLSIAKPLAIGIAAVLALSAGAAAVPALPSSQPAAPPSAPANPVALAPEKDPPVSAPVPLPAADAVPPLPQIPYPLPTEFPVARPVNPTLLPQWLKPLSSMGLTTPPGQYRGTISHTLAMPDGSLLTIGGALDDINGQRCGHYFVVRWDRETWQATSLTAGLGSSADRFAAAADGSTALISFPNWFDRGEHGGYMKFINLAQGGEPAPPVYSFKGWFQPLGVSPDGKTGYCRMTGEGPLLVWDMHTGRKREEIPCPARMATQLLCDPLGRFVALGGYMGDEKVFILQLADRSWHTLEGHQNTVKAMAVSPDGQFLATGSDDCTVRIWDLATLKQRHCLRGHNAGITAVAFSADDALLASSAGYGSIQTNAAGQPVAVAGENSLRLWRMSDGELAGGGELPGFSTSNLAFSSDGMILRVSSGIEMEFSVDTLLKVNVAALLPAKAQIQLDELRTINPEGGMGHCAATAPDGSSVTIAQFGALERFGLPDLAHETLRRWDRYVLAMDLRSAAALAHDTYSESPPLQCLDLTTGAVRWQADGFAAHTAVFSPDATVVAATAGRYYKPSQGLAMRPRSELRLINSADGTTLRTVPDVQDTANALVFSPDGKRLYVGSGHLTPSPSDGMPYLNCAIEAFDVASGKRTLIFEQPARPVTALALSPDGKHIYASTDAGITAFDTATGARQSRANIGAEILCLDISPDGRYIAAGDQQTNVNILDVATLKMLARDDRPTNAIHLIRFVNDTQFISCGWSDPLRLWQLRPKPRAATAPATSP